MLSKVQAALAKTLAPGEPLLVGVSGGADSVALLSILVELGWRPRVCHLNHQLRGVDSDADAEFVRQLATQYGLPSTIEACTVDRDEDSARRARQEFFGRVAERTGIKKLVLAHTADDQVETFLLRLLRGAGVPGLVGIWPERQLGTLRVIRPMLKVRRLEIMEYLAAKKLSYREDKSNTDTRFTRNRIRHGLLPLLEREYNPAIRDVLLNTAEILRDEDFYLLHHVAQRFYMAACQNDAVNVKTLANYQTAIQRRVLRFWLGGDSENGPSFTFEQIEAVRHAALGDAPGAAIDLPDDLVVYREYEWLRKARRKDLEPVKGNWPLSLSGETVILELGMRFILRHSDESPRPKECFDADALGEGLFVRTWENGDRFQPLGMSETKKLQDFFVDEKVPRLKRGRVPLVCTADGRIAWVVGGRIAEPFKVRDDTHRILCMSAEAIQG
ncbi:MAG TPA: tRNA lysidine(34) synthetase TilS [Verrucomicrobiae bacterium]|nr:tRNA lysidine(34) synthetase TilS [Verrucomicrobiae bacterium]